jgi:antitoxin ChpS
VPIVRLEQLDAGSVYPTPGCVRCEVLARWRDSSETERVRISTANPDHIESTEGRSEFVVLSAQLKPLYTLDELLEGSDGSVPQSQEEREWIDAPPVGGELL